MHFLLVLAFASVVLAGSVLPNEGRIGRPMTDKIDAYVLAFMENNGELELVADPEDGTMEIDPQFVLSWQVRRQIRKIQKQMPCGWPQYGIPSLAPLKVRETEVSFKRGILEIKFDFLFRNIKASADKYETDTILDAMRQLGLSVQYEGNGSLEFGLKNLHIAGVLKYKIPILWGSTKITSLKTEISLEQFSSDITGFMGDGSISRMINRQIENFVEMGINNNQKQISDMIEDTLVPKVNKILKGNDLWTLIDRIFSSSDGKSENDPIITNCVAPADPWA